MANIRDYEESMNEIQDCIAALPTEAILEAHGMWRSNGAAILGAWAGMNGYTALETACQTFTGMLGRDLA